MSETKVTEISLNGIRLATLDLVPIIKDNDAAMEAVKNVLTAIESFEKDLAAVRSLAFELANKI